MRIKDRYANQIINGQMCVWLQNHGFQPAKLGSEIVPGDHLVYNNGATAEVLEAVKETPCFRTIKVLCPATPYRAAMTYEQRIKKDAYWAVQ